MPELLNLLLVRQIVQHAVTVPAQNANPDITSAADLAIKKNRAVRIVPAAIRKQERVRPVTADITSAVTLVIKKNRADQTALGATRQQGSAKPASPDTLSGSENVCWAEIAWVR